MKNSNTKQFLLWFRDSVAKPTSRSIMQSFARRYGKAIGLVYVGGYPKSGTTWISRMAAHYLALPMIGHSYLGLGFPAVIHHHWSYHPAFVPSVFVIRDGRDVMVSIYSNMVIKGYCEVEKTLAELSKISSGRLLRRYLGRHAVIRRRLHHLFGPRFDPEDVVGNLPRFIEAEMQKPFIPEVRQPWPPYVSDWLSRGRRIPVVKYEDMLAHPEPTLASMLQNLLDEEPRSEEIAYTVARFSFERLYGRKQGEEDRSSFARKGIMGDWVNCFSSEACQVFDHYAGDLLIELGYETGHDWVHATSHAQAGCHL